MVVDISKNIAYGLLLGLAGFLGSCDDPDAYKGPDGKESGKIIYQKECLQCHGERGDDGNGGAANLQNSLLTEDEMKDAVKKGRGEMRAVSHLNEEQVQLVIDYVRNELKKKD